MGIVICYITYFSTQQEISCPVPNFGFYPNFPKISNSGIPVSFLGLRRDENWPVPSGGTETGPGRGCSRMLGTGNFLDFSLKNPVPGKWHLGTQTSTIWGYFLRGL